MMDTFYQTLNNLGYTHPVHPLMVYLPIGCVMAAFIFAVCALLCKRPGLSDSARHCITLALIAVLPTIILGYMDWQHFLGGNWVFPIRMKTILAGSLLVLLSLTVLCAWKFSGNRSILLALYTLCLVNVATIGYFGGELVFAGFKPQMAGFESASVARKQEPTSIVTYADVADIFQQICSRCHKGQDAPYNLQLDTYEHAMEGGLEGKVIIPGNPDESELVLRIKGLSRPAMPFGMAPLPQGKIDTIVRWIKQGAQKGEPPSMRNKESLPPYNSRT